MDEKLYEGSACINVEGAISKELQKARWIRCNGLFFSLWTQVDLGKCWSLIFVPLVFESWTVLLYVCDVSNAWSVVWLHCELAWVLKSRGNRMYYRTCIVSSQEQRWRAAICLNGIKRPGGYVWPFYRSTTLTSPLFASVISAGLICNHNREFFGGFRTHFCRPC